MQAFATACAGFLLAVLWFDLMHDVLARGDGPTDEGLDTIRRYYRRVTRGAAPMNRLVMIAMVGLLGTLVAQVIGDSVPTWAAGTSLAFALPPIVLAGASTVPTAVRLGQGEDGAPEARRVLAQHGFCFVCIATVIAVQLASL